MTVLNTALSFRSRSLDEPATADVPLIIAIHGGTYSSAYFDLPGFSLLDRAARNGIPLIAIDRPGYGDSLPMPPAEATLKGQARYLLKPLRELWERHGEGRGIVLIGHSIGAAIATVIASDPGDLPVIGLAISGVCLRTPAAHRPMWEAFPNTPFVEMPAAIKDEVMFGPAGSFDAATPAASHAANAPAPKAELVDIVSTWHNDVHAILATVAVPVHYRQGEFDRLWIVDEGDVNGFARALSASPRVDAEMMRGTGHCMDFHTIGAALHLQQLGFALQCAAERREK